MRDLSAIRIVLVGTTDSGNIGAAARAMKTMGLSDLALVDPREFPSDKAVARASGAGDVLERALVVERVEDAIADCNLVMGASARLRAITVPADTPRETATRIATLPDDSRIALLFGREKTGLTNAELDLCQRLIHVPANPEYSSLNLAMAVQVMAYELRQTLLAPGVETPSDVPPATQAAMDGLFEHLERALIHLRYLNPDNPRLLMRRLRRLFHRATPDSDEVNLLRGVLTKIERCTPPQRD
ncbi:RNA methyltransferase [Abyssibacter sp.]|jgi:tRNA (cytidine32/uridine32-2'-O)-methyltransferase|uniref:RNA methyltransferase n=1 Tax=Abyssibacter sp. TaxID=2320200 RepID=UPI000C69B4A2|nr:RNA methyltransferase [Abyssibacter sp.]MBB87225.1 tRNA (cytosine(32)/uridine(32)-2'-O)-methyltransferase TrmJ [Xanthomonadales bacterium]MCK5857788.1 RNA methyltransferase [Abyssibacter sp.]